MKLSKLLLGAILIGITIQNTACIKDRKPKADSKKVKKHNKEENYEGCPACGMG